jgi:uncharacterized protein YfbU (UPF0304 family)
MTLSDGEKLILMMLCEIYKRLEMDDTEIEPKFVQETIWGGHYWGLKWKYSGLFHDHEDSDKSVGEVADILEVWSFIELSFGRLSKADQDRVKKEAYPWSAIFIGFDGNNEGEHLGIARYLTEQLDRFSEFKGRELNSHSPRLDGYRRMLPMWEKVRSSIPYSDLSADQLIELLEAQSGR